MPARDPVSRGIERNDSADARASRFDGTGRPLQGSIAVARNQNRRNLRIRIAVRLGRIRVHCDTWVSKQNRARTLLDGKAEQSQPKTESETDPFPAIAPPMLHK